MTSAAPLFQSFACHALQWYAVRVRSHCERVASSTLQAKGYQQFLPEVCSRRRWSDRTKELQVPLFPGYVFCRFDAAHRVPVLESAGVAGIVSFGTLLAPIPAEEIQAVETMLRLCHHVEPYPSLPIGQKIRIEHGPLAGVEGIVVALKNGFRLVASVTLLQRSVSVEIDRDWACPVQPVRTRLEPLHARNDPQKPDYQSAPFPARI
jgi:transcription antitermination factor NusG